ncbi:ubiquitin-like domain-containing protein [uncultured Gemmiger sp.]|uniref:ubiquitin-like domain-containing protein n=1 Tax=uncultured Gemmiger sp. TaxID=1623490 RepID=UPI0025ED2614|nr:ubiquitin-like domain-containing protein [uncultured Gemmiger sp.]
MIQPKTKEHIRRWLCRHMPKYLTLAGSLAVLACVVGVTSSQLKVVTVSDSHGKRATVVSAERKVVDLIAQAGITPSGRDDELLVTETSATTNSIHILRAYNVPVTADGQTVSVVTTGGTVEDVLADGGIQLGPDDEVEPARGTEIEEGDTITVRRVTYDTYTVEETIPAEVVYQYTSLFYRQKNYEQVMQQGSDGLDLVTYQDKYVDGQWVSKAELNRVTQVGMVQNIIKAYGEGVPVSSFVGPEIVDGQPAEGVTQVFTSQRSTGYSASQTAKGASGRRLSYGTVAVNPSIIPYGTLLYITSDDGRFIYGYAYAADTGTAMMTGHAFIDLYYETYDESCKNAVIPVTVYVISDEVADQYKEQNDAILEANIAARGIGE